MFAPFLSHVKPLLGFNLCHLKYFATLYGFARHLAGRFSHTRNELKYE